MNYGYYPITLQDKDIIPSPLYPIFDLFNKSLQFHCTKP